MAHQVGTLEAEREQISPAPLAHQEFYTAADGTQWLIRIRVQWLPQFASEIEIVKLPEGSSLPVPPNLPYHEVIPKRLREAALDGNYDLQAITRYCLQRCLVTLREYIERFGNTL